MTVDTCMMARSLIDEAKALAEKKLGKWKGGAKAPKAPADPLRDGDQRRQMKHHIWPQRDQLCRHRAQIAQAHQICRGGP